MDAAEDAISADESSMEEIIVDIGGCPVHFAVPKNRNISPPLPEDAVELEVQGRAFMTKLREVESVLTPEIWTQYRAAVIAKDERDAADWALLAELKAVEGAMTREVWDRIWANRSKLLMGRVLALKRRKTAEAQREYRDMIMDPKGTVRGMVEAIKVLAVAKRKHGAKQWHHDEDVREILKGHDYLKESLQREGGSPCDAEETGVVLKKLASVDAQRRFLQSWDDESDIQDGFLRA
ncbi:hypothetical protein B0A48_09679 [Cryoendolithus antarcticus]|uniref:Uncharacterized protein n=1 Tax=Cryoendolithus antarcticus TaxID=1507870 RepID=A0A1V8T016_9PEZI|nr:hypothetical protein B0A48_09679 [Cryoendolithus antarcticus]